MVNRKSFVTAVVTLILALFSTAGLLAQDDSETTHIVQRGENLFRIALSYGLTTQDLMAANNITDPSRIFAGQTLIIPGQAGTGGAEAEPQAGAVPEQPAANDEVIVAPDEAPTTTQPIYYTISRGDTLRDIARAHGVTEADLITWNSIANPNRILAGQAIIVGSEAAAPVADPFEPGEALPAQPASAADVSELESVQHTVAAGEHLGTISRRYNVGPELIVAVNNITDPNRIFVGQTLTIPTSATPDEIEAIVYAPPQARYGVGREIVVDLSNSQVYAYENGMLLYYATSSNGLPATPTVQGEFTVRTKVRSQTMSGPGYYLPNVEWVLYFYQGYALHGAYWHNNFGQPMSHGCVNLRNEDAQWFYNFATEGMPVTVQY